MSSVIASGRGDKVLKKPAGRASNDKGAAEAAAGAVGEIIFCS